MKFCSALGAILLTTLLLPCPALPCTLCGVQAGTTLVKEVQDSRAVFYGLATASTISADGRDSSTEFTIVQVFKDDGLLENRKTLKLDGYTPILDRKNPPALLVYLEVFNGAIAPRRGKMVKNADAATYLAQSLKAVSGPRTEALLHFFRWLEHADPVISEDAFLEIARSNDQEVGEAARLLKVEDVRRMLTNPATPSERLSLLAFLLGACGTEQDAKLLRDLIARPNQRQKNALDGVLCGLITMHPKEGWDLTARILANRRPNYFTEQLCAVRVLKFHHGWKPKESRAQVLRCLEVILDNVELADLAVDDLRRWEIWDFTPKVLALHGSKAKGVSPILQRHVLRYALCCPQPEGRKLIDQVRARDPETIADLEEQLAFQKSR